jgi:hypothetical protein
MADDAAFAVLAHKVDTMHQDFSEIRTVLRDLTTAINKLALVEERQQVTATSLERAFKVLERIEGKFEALDLKVDAISTRVMTLEAAEPEQRRTSDWVMRAVWGAAGLAVMLILAKLGVAA